jgi:squalene-associated FAD-dependent desaturase
VSGPRSTDLPVAVVGGGLAGISAALRLADRGHPVVLFEARSHLGGATYSFQRGELTVDTGQHVFLRCYHSYRQLLHRLGTSDLGPIQERFSIPVLYRPRPDGLPRTVWLRRGTRAPAPLHLAGGLTRYSPLTVPERALAAAAAVALRTVDPDDPSADQVAFGQWLRQRRQSDRAIARLWALITVAALNLHPDEASLALAARVFRTGLLERSDAADLGIPATSLRRLHADPASRLLARLGVRAHTGTKVRRIDLDGARFVVRTRSDECPARAVVVAVPHQAATRLVPAEAASDRHRWAGLGSSPIVNVHLHYDRRVTTLPFAAALDSPVQWVFDRTAAAGARRGQYLVVSLSAASDQVARPTQDLVREFVVALGELFPLARAARLLDAFVTREPHATFHQRPGTASLRPPPLTKLPGLVLAGAWTRTGWPDTMEGAVRSGLRAADLLDRYDRAPHDALTEALP